MIYFKKGGENIENTKSFISKKILTCDMLVKTVKVSDKGQIAIPTEVRNSIGIKKGDTLIMIQDHGKILIEKESKKIKDDFRDLLKHSEQVAEKLWGSKEDDIWDRL